LAAPLDLILQLFFWLAIAATVYTYLGYPIVITILARLRRRPVRAAPITPSVSLIIPAFDEEKVIGEKLDNSMSLDYPADRLEIVVVSDGSTDATNQIVSRYAADGLRLLYDPPRRGKIAALNRSVPLTQGEILVFTDANAMLNPPALRRLVRHFADDRVACVGGEKRVGPAANLSAQGESAYWRYESYLKRCDSAVGSLMGVAGELFAMRRAFYTPIQEDTLIEDFVLSLHLVKQGWRVVYEPEAVAWEQPTLSLGDEWQRRTRIAAGGFQAIVRLRGMLNPALGLAAFQFLSHRVLRWIAPGFMIAALLINPFLTDRVLYRWTLLGQTLLYLAALLGYFLLRVGVRSRPLQLVFYFCFTNLAALVGLYRYISGTQAVTWKKVRA
jgi:biofilm PGA synthesis N-glycosyltransferase PgaC